MLDNLFTLQSCADLEVGAPLPFLHDQNYYYKLFNTVCGAQLLDGDPLIPVYFFHSKCFFYYFKPCELRRRQLNYEILSFEKVMLSCQVQSWVGIEPTTS